MKLEASQAHAQELEMMVEQLDAEKRYVYSLPMYVCPCVCGVSVCVLDYSECVVTFIVHFRKLDKQVEHLTEDLRAKDVRVRELAQQLK